MGFQKYPTTLGEAESLTLNRLTFSTHGTELTLGVFGFVSPVLFGQVDFELGLRNDLEALDAAGAAGVGMDAQEVRVQVPLDYLGWALRTLNLHAQLELLLVTKFVVLVLGRLQHFTTDPALKFLGGSEKHKTEVTQDTNFYY